MKHHLGMHDEIHNVYGLTWDKVVKEQFEKRNPDRRVFQMTRAAYAGLQRYTFGWTGDSGNGDDVLQGWGQLANQIPVMLSAGLGLIPFSSCDITGYCGDVEDYPAMAELYTRWIQFGAFNPLSRIPVSYTHLEVVVVGYGTMKKSDLTGAVSSVGVKDIKDSPVANIGQRCV